MADNDPLHIPINSNNFPAKLWRLVNGPSPQPIYWDGSGEVVVIDQEPFQKLFLSPGQWPVMDPPGRPTFKTSHFASFVRQLNLYGFRKISRAFPANGTSPTAKSQTQHHYYNPDFKKNHPELLVNLKRLTKSNKTKLEAGLEVNRRGKQTKNRGRSEFARQTPKPSFHPYPENRSQPMEESNWARVAAHNWVMGHSDASSPSILYTDNSPPVGNANSRDASSTIPPHIQQGARGFVNPGQILSNFIFPHAQYGHGYYSPVCQCTHQSSLDSDMTGGNARAPSFSPYGCYKPNCPASFLCPLSQNPHLQNTASHTLDEVQVSSAVCMVQVPSPDKLISLSEGDRSINESILPISLDLSVPFSYRSEPPDMDANPPTCSEIIAASDGILQGKPFKVDGAGDETVKKEQREVLNNMDTSQRIC